MMDGNKIKTTIRELLELGGLLKTGEFDISYVDATKDAEWITAHVQVRPKKTTWNAALNQLPPQHPIMMRLLEWMSGAEKVELYRLFYLTIKRWTEPDSALPDDQREKLTAICEDTLEALSKAPKKSEEHPTPIVMLDKKIEELKLDIEERVVCESCTKKATDQTEQPELRPLLASMCNSILEIVEDFSDTDERSTSLVKHLTKLQERAERVGLVLATKL